MRIEVLFFDGCPGFEELVPRLRRIVADVEVDAELELRRVETVDQAQAEGFLGSPTVRVDGRDVDPTAAARSDYGMKCRLYRSDEGTSRLPPDEWLHRALAAS